MKTAAILPVQELPMKKLEAATRTSTSEREENMQMEELKRNTDRLDSSSTRSASHISILSKSHWTDAIQL